MIQKAFIKKKLLTYWYRKIKPNATYKDLRQDKVYYSLLNKKYFTFKVRAFFTFLFVVATLYFLVIKSELYESKTAIVIRNLTTPQPASNIGLSLLGMGSNSQLQDSMILQEYVKSLDMLLILDKKFHLIDHYKSNAIDFVERLPKDATMEESLAFYNKRIFVNYDDASSIIHIAFTNTDPKEAQKVLEFILQKVTSKINELNKIKAEKQLSFIINEYKKKKKQMEESTAKLEAFQNKYKLLDPTVDATASNTIIAGLEDKLTQKKIEYKTKSSYLNANNYELSALKAEIQELINSIAQKKGALIGTGNMKLNKILFKYEKLKMQLDFDVEVYKQSLIQLENIKIEIMQQAKMLSIISKPHLPDGYTYPDKPKAFITIIIVILLSYGIFSMLLAIIKDHKE